MKSVNNRRIVLFIVCFLFCLQFVIFLPTDSRRDSTQSISYPTGLETSMENGLEDGAPEYHPSEYIYEKDNHYLSHDWIADQAIRLIASHGEYKKYVENWIYDSTMPYSNFGDLADEDYPNPDYGKIQDTQMYKVPKLLWVRPWWHIDHYAGATIPALTEDQWLYARRYSRMLWGTMAPDYSSEWTRRILIGPYLDEKSDRSDPDHGVNAEQVAEYRPEWIDHNSKLRPHSIFFKEIEDGVFIPAKLSEDNFKYGNGAEYTQWAALDALYYLNYEEEYEGGETKRQGKYEAAAIALGGMSHFIADVAVPDHTKWVFSQSGHSSWEKWYAYENGGKMYFNDDLGEPESSGININEYISSQALVDEVLPYDCAVLMAEMTYTAYDDPNHHIKAETDTPLDAGRIGNPFDDTLTAEYQSLIGDRAKKLASYAVYYTACAFLWVLTQTNIDERDTTEHRLEPIKGNVPDSTIPNYANEMSVQRITELIKEEGSVKVGEKNVVLASMAMVPLAVLALAGVGKGISDEIKESKGKSDDADAGAQQEGEQTVDEATAENGEVYNNEPNSNSDLQSDITPQETTQKRLDDFLPSPPKLNTKKTNSPSSEVGRTRIRLTE